MRCRMSGTLAVIVSTFLLTLLSAHGGSDHPPGIAGTSAVQADDSASSRLKWSDWRAVPNGGSTNVAPFAISYSGKLYLFTVGIGDQHIYVNTYDGTAWSGPSLFSASTQTKQQVCGAVCNNKLVIYACDVHIPAFIYRYEKSGEGSWQEYFCSDVDTYGKDPSAIADGPATYLFFRGVPDNQIYYWLDSTYLRQAGPCPVPPGDATTDVPLGGCTWQGQLWLFGKGIGDSRPYFTYYNQEGWPGAWFRLWGGWQTDVSIAATVYKRTMYVFVNDVLGNRIHYLETRDPSSTWWFSRDIPGELWTTYAVSAVVHNGELYVFAVANDQTLRYNILTSK
jgi:hypothetical protein